MNKFVSLRNCAIGLLLLAVVGCVEAETPEQAYEQKLAAVVPTPAQYRWQRQHDLYAFIHFGINTFTDREWGTGKESPALFNPSAVDARQWAKALKSANMTMIVVTAKHHDGFCLWPSRYTLQSVKSSPWKNGQGDVVRECVEAARAEGMAIGIYLSPADLFQIENAAGYYGDGSASVESVIPTDPAHFKDDPSKGRPAPAGAPVFHYKADSYNRYFLNQLYELLTEYGPVDEVWFDGATPKSKGGQQYAYAAWYDLIRKLQPNAIIFGKGPDARWVGNERGVARESEWSVVGLPQPASSYTWPDMTGKILGGREQLRKAASFHWYPAEADVSIRPGWFFHQGENNRVKSADTLVDIYEKSIGRNATLILNTPPDRRGLLHENDVRSLAEFGSRIRETYAKNLAGGATVTAGDSAGTAPGAIVDGDYETAWEGVPWKSPWTLEVALPSAATFNQVLLQEQIRRGQRVESFTVEARTGGQWRKIAQATTIGYKRILPVNEITADALRIRFDSARVAPTLAEFGIYHAPGQFPVPEIVRSVDGKVSISPANAQWLVRYALNGAKPDGNAPEYAAPLDLKEGGTVSAQVIRRKDNTPGSVAVRDFGYAKNTLKLIEKTSPASPVLDENPNTFGSVPGNTFTIDLGSSRPIAGFTYLPRQDGASAGTIESYEACVSDTPTISGASLKAGRFDNIRNNPIEQSVRFAKPVSGRYLILKATQILDQKTGIAAAELGVLGK